MAGINANVFSVTFGIDTIYRLYETYHDYCEGLYMGIYHFVIRSSDNDSTGLWPPGSLHTLDADGHI